MVERSQTIAAIATAPGRGGVAVIRVSGPDAFAVAERIAGAVPAPGHFRLATFRQPINADPSAIKQSNDSNSRTILDTGLLLSFKGPHSYTGEDVIEFHCHGGTVTPRRVLRACFAAGARPARRGEFTERAFLHGRLDYDQAESVLDLIDAKTERAADAALAGLAGRKVRELRRIYDALLALSSTVEHALDVDEGELPPTFADGLTRELAAVRESIRITLVRLREGRLLREGALVVLAGPPNAGKSSLLNALLGEHRAIVSPIAGTTRDTIEEWVDFGGWPVRLVDTAGLREGADELEAAGVQRAESMIARADVILRLTPCGEREVMLAPDAAGRTIEVCSKADLAPTASDGFLAVSAKTGAGLDELRRAIVARLEAKAAAAGDDGAAADETVAALHAAQVALAGGTDDLVLLGNALAQAAAVVGAPLGATYSEDLLERLFSRFCVGK